MQAWLKGEVRVVPEILFLFGQGYFKIRLSVVTMWWPYIFVSGVDTDKNPIETTAISPEGRVEADSEEIPTENGNNNIADSEKVSLA